MTKEFEMSQEDLSILIAACEKQKSIKKDLEVASQKVNNLWEALGEKMAFDHTTARPSGKDPARFTASPVKPYSIKSLGCSILSVSNELPPSFDKAGYESLEYKAIT